MDVFRLAEPRFIPPRLPRRRIRLKKVGQPLFSGSDGNSPFGASGKVLFVHTVRGPPQ
jgi:hypothetical protein